MQARILDAMSGEQRVLLAFEMSHYTHELAKQGIRDRHADWPEDKSYERVPAFTVSSR